MKKTVVFAILMILLLAACQDGTAAEATPPSGGDEAVPQTGAEATAIPAATLPPAATATDLPAPTAAPTQTPTEEAPAAPAAGAGVADPEEAVIAAMRKLSEQESFRVEQTINAPGEATVMMNVEIIPPSRYHLDAGDFELMIIEGVTYLKATEDQWVQTGNVGENFVSTYTWINSDEDVEQFRSTVDGVAFIGEETLDGEPTRRYQYDLKEPSENAFLRNNLWVGTDGLPRKLEVLISAGVAGESDQGSVVMLYKDFGADDIIIEPPQ